MRTFNRRQFLSFGTEMKPRPSDYWVHVSRRAMACRFEITLPAADRRGIIAARQALDEIDRLEAQLTVYQDDSEVSFINRTGSDAPVAVEPHLFDLLRLSQILHRETHGAFDIT